MGLDDLAKKAGDALSSDKAEAISDKALDAAAGAAKKATGGKYDDKIDTARDASTASSARSDPSGSLLDPRHRGLLIAGTRAPHHVVRGPRLVPVHLGSSPGRIRRRPPLSGVIGTKTQLSPTGTSHPRPLGLVRPFPTAR